jgi:hypothetical protein
MIIYTLSKTERLWYLPKTKNTYKLLQNSLPRNKTLKRALPIGFGLRIMSRHPIKPFLRRLNYYQTREIIALNVVIIV